MNVILSHDHSDFDAVASQLGAWKLYPDWTPVVAHHLNRNVRDFLTLHWDALPFKWDEELPPESNLARAMLVDTQRLPTLQGFDTRRIPEIHVIDHHGRRDDLPPAWTVALDDTGSCTTLLVERIAEQQLPLTWVEATLLLLGIHEDTGSLLYSGTTARDGQAVAWLLARGATVDIVRQFLDRPLTDHQRTLYSRLLAGTQILEVHGFQIVVASATMEAYVDDVSALARSVRELYDPAALVLAVEMSGHVQLVARATTPEANMGELMGRFGGGGHARAAAAIVEGEPLARVVRRLGALLPDYVRPTVRVSDWMSRGRVRLLRTTARIQEAAEMMRRWGHEGFPVVDEAGEVVGVLTRRDVDRALQHKLDNTPVTQVMHKGNLVVTPHDPIARVQRVMTEANIGQVPVVDPETGEVVGIITRTDLLQRAERPRSDQHAREWMDKVAAALPPPALALVRRIAGEAHALGYQAYLVAGVVRDIVLDSPTKDLDIVIEGNAIALARQLARTLGGRVVAHERFGTAKWLLRDPDRAAAPRDPLLASDALPPHIDLITARTEFYERPTALPQVEHASVKQDLHRRDFTINTLALALDPQHEGHLLDFYGGVADLQRGIVRVLHNLSFVEDPTRILRAVRFEQRLAFTLHHRTHELLLASVGLLEKVSPDRLRHELFLILQERRAARMLARLDELGILTLLLPGVAWDERRAEQLARLHAAGERSPEAALAALLWHLEGGPDQVERVVARLGLSGEWRTSLLAIYQLRKEHESRQGQPLPNSALHAWLHPHPPVALELLATLTEDEALRRQLRHYLDDLRHRRPAVGGAELRAAGLPPGPLYRQILGTLHAALLDDLAPDEASQRALLAAEVARHGATKAPGTFHAEEDATAS